MESKCPNCGYCPTCGRANTQPYNWPMWPVPLEQPFNPYWPIWVVPTPVWINPMPVTYITSFTTTGVTQTWPQ